MAVLYLDNLSRDTADAYIAEGLTDAIITRLGQVERLTVKSRNAVVRFRGGQVTDPAAVGRALRVANLVNGAVRRSGNRLRITVELTRAATGVRLWGDQFTRSDEDLLGIEEDVARAVARAVAGRLLPGEQAALSARPTRNRAAYDHLLRGNVYLAQRNPAGAVNAITEFEAAALLDTTFGEALARLAMTYEFFLDWGWSYAGLPAESILARGIEAADRARALTPLSSDAWMARALLLSKRSPRSYDGVRAAFERALALEPRNAEAHHQFAVVLWQLGLDSVAAAEAQRALAIEPERPITLVQLALIEATGRRPREAARSLDSALALDPTFSYALALRAFARVRLGDLQAAREDAENAGRFGGGYLLPAEAARATVEAASGATGAGRARAERLPSYFVDPAQPIPREGLFAALAFLALGDRERAVDLLGRVEPRGAELWSGLRLPEFDPLRGDPRFARLVEEARPSHP